MGEVDPTVLVGEADDLAASAIREVVVRQGLEVVGRAHNAVEALTLNDHLHPGVVVLRHELPGTTGLEAARELRALDAPPEVVLVSSDLALARPAEEAGVLAVVPPRDVEALEQALVLARDRVTTGERRSGVDRRAGLERRVHQDWAKVFAERRSGEDRRRGPRRSSD